MSRDRETMPGKETHAMNETNDRRTGGRPLVFETEVRLLTNRYMLYDFVRWMGLTYAAMGIIAGIIGLAVGDMDAFVGVVSLFAMICAGMTVLFILIMLLFFGNRLKMAFRIDAAGVAAQVVSRRARAGNRLAIVLGTLAGNPGATGAGLVARSQENIRFDFADIRRVRYDAARGVISLRDKWFRRLRIYCPQGRYAEAARLVADGLLRTGRQGKKGAK